MFYKSGNYVDCFEILRIFFPLFWWFKNIYIIEFVTEIYQNFGPKKKVLDESGLY
jgi:hypothetical protein